ncbi:hypothetical protein MSG28_005535 [Choristoneura fumiferana]|uniref:Uncharacterized protein n=1 Tax=Choristoneura fumiferana TaxID=7141 RepID=A0ACC0KZ41_CHOFU|nr:hypothetical protein MSG28_005535 [Choristoneura fumiferana]
MCGITFEIYHELCGEAKHREETCTNLRSDSMVRAKFPIRTGPAWELWPKPSCSERRPVPSSGTGVFQSLVEKHFPAPDRGRINRLLGLEAPQKVAPHPAPRPALPAARNGADDAHTSKRKLTARQQVNMAAKRARGGSSSDEFIRGSEDEAEAESADERRRSDSESDSNPFRAGSGSDSDTEPWMRKKKPLKKKKNASPKKKPSTTQDKIENMFERKNNVAPNATVTVTAPGGHSLTGTPVGTNGLYLGPARNQPPPRSAIERACSMKEELLAAIERLAKRLPPNTLDQLVDELGGTENVAEMTGRKGRVVQTEDGQILYESRSEADVPLETLNLTEKQRFMDGEKDVAIISEAASSGISLQSDRRARNQRRRVHITLELPWSADRAIQQFGRTHRSNQVNAPEYIFLISDLAGERRFASTVAKRLESLGALTHGDRRATETRDLSQFNIDNKYGRTALEAVMKAIMKYETPLVPPPRDYNGDFFQDIASALVGVGLIINSESAPGVLSLDKDYNNMSKFLNRILGMPVDLQNRLFKYFTDTLTAVMEQAKRSGRFDLGILDLGSAGECVRRVRCVRYLRRHATGTAPVQLHTVHSEVTKGPPPLLQLGTGQCVRRVRCVRYLRRHATGTAPVQLHTVHSEAPPPPAAGQCVRRVRCVRYLRRHATGTAPVQLHTVHSERGMEWTDALEKHSLLTGPKEGFYLSLTARNNKYTAVLCCATAQPHARAKLTKKEQMYQIYSTRLAPRLQPRLLARQLPERRQLRGQYCPMMRPRRRGVRSTRPRAASAATPTGAPAAGTPPTARSVLPNDEGRHVVACAARGLAPRLQPRLLARQLPERRQLRGQYCPMMRPRRGVRSTRPRAASAATPTGAPAAGTPPTARSVLPNDEAQTSWRAQHEASRRVCSHAYWRASCRNAANCEVTTPTGAPAAGTPPTARSVLPNDEAQTWRAQHEASRRVCSHAYWRASCRNAANCEVGLRLRTYHVLSGSVLAVWARVEGVLAQRSQLNKMQVVRIKTDEGLKIVGTMIPKNCVEPLKETLASDAVNVTEQVFDTTDTLKGVGAMEIVAMDMKLRGMYIARQLSFHGVSFKIEEVPLTDAFRDTYDKSVALWVEAMQRFTEAAELIDAEARMKKTMWGQFWSAHQRFFKYLCIAAKVHHAVVTAREAVKCGKCVVIGLQSTGEARTLDQLERDDGELSDFVSTAKLVPPSLYTLHSTPS